ncbi:MAG TPA: cytochrome D1 domain-containing protein [Gemmatimonadales bacterium]|nr:cytochrome D1 domain-containing protein [Gemmatimonadales bacterium]
MRAALLVLGLMASPSAPPPATGTLVVLNKAEATASLIDVASGKVVATLPTGEGPHEAAASPDGRTVLVANYGTGPAAGRTLSVIDVPGLRVRRTIELPSGSRPHGVWFLDGTKALVTAEGIGALLVVDVEKGTVLATIETGQRVSHMVAASPDGKRAYVANIGSGTMTAIDLVAGRVLAQVETGAGAEGIAVRPDGREIWVTNRSANTVSLIDAASLREVAELPSADFPIRVAFTPDGARALVSNAKSGDLALFDVAARREVARMKGDAATVAGGNMLGAEGAVPVGILVDPTGARAYVAYTAADVVGVYDLATGSLATMLGAGREPDGMALSSVILTGR